MPNGGFLETFPGEISPEIAISTNCRRIERVRDPSSIHPPWILVSATTRDAFDTQCLSSRALMNFPSWWKFSLNEMRFALENSKRKIIKRKKQVGDSNLGFVFILWILTICRSDSLIWFTRSLIVCEIFIYFFSFLFFPPPPNLFQIEIVNICAENFTINQFRRDTNRYY